MRSSLNILRFTALLFPIFMSTSCTDDPIEIPEPDTTAPQSMVLFPVDGESVSGEVIIQVRAVDNDRVDSVQFLIKSLNFFSSSVFLLLAMESIEVISFLALIKKVCKSL